MPRLLALAAVCLLVPLRLAALDAASDTHRGMVLFRLHLGQGGGADRVTPEAMRTFIDEVVTPRFKAGLTVIEARGQWAAPDDGAITRENTTIVELACFDTGENRDNVAAVAKEYVRRFAAAGSAAYVEELAVPTATLYFPKR